MNIRSEVEINNIMFNKQFWLSHVTAVVISTLSNEDKVNLRLVLPCEYYELPLFLIVNIFILKPQRSKEDKKKFQPQEIIRRAFTFEIN